MVKARIAVLGDAHLVEGFQLAGLADAFLSNDQEFSNALEEMLRKPEYGILVVNETWLKNVDWKLRKKLDNLAYPVIIPLPAAGEKSIEGDEIRNLIKRTLGFDLAKK